MGQYIPDITERFPEGYGGVDMTPSFFGEPVDWSRAYQEDEYDYEDYDETEMEEPVKPVENGNGERIMLKYANTEINFTVERLVEIAQLAIDGMRCDDEDSALEYITDTMELTDYEREFFGVPVEEKEDDGYDDDSDRGCSDCPPDECDGHCMSCYYRPV